MECERLLSISVERIRTNRLFQIELEEEQDVDVYDRCDNEVDKFELYQSAAITSFNQSGRLQPPEVILRMDQKTDVIREKLGIATDNDNKLSVHICPDKENQSVLNCNVREIMISFCSSLIRFRLVMK